MPFVARESARTAVNTRRVKQTNKLKKEVSRKTQVFKYLFWEVRIIGIQKLAGVQERTKFKAYNGVDWERGCKWE